MLRNQWKYNRNLYKEYGIYSKLTDNRDLIPNVTTNNISCPLSDFVPQILSYKEGTKQTEELEKSLPKVTAEKVIKI